MSVTKQSIYQLSKDIDYPPFKFCIQLRYEAGWSGWQIDIRYWTQDTQGNPITKSLGLYRPPYAGRRRYRRYNQGLKVMRWVEHTFMPQQIQDFKFNKWIKSNLNLTYRKL